MTVRILFRFHKNYDVCIQNLQTLRQLNPDIKIDGLYGGEDNIEDLPAPLTDLLDSCWNIPLDDPYYKWKNADLCVRWWFREQGLQHDFSHLLLLEWDLLLLKPVAQAYPPLEKGCNYAPIFGDSEYAKEINWFWIGPVYEEELGDMKRKFTKKGYPTEIDGLQFGLMGGSAICREFLEKFSQEHVNSYSNDEFRMSMYSRAYNIPLHDNKLRSNPLNMFSAMGDIFNEQDLDAVLVRNGDAIHPIRTVIPNLDQKIKEHREKQ